MKGLQPIPIPENILRAAQAAGVDIDAVLSEPLPEPVYQCDLCQDLGQIKIAGLNPGEVGFGKLYPCPNPNCSKGNELRSRVWEARYKNARIPDHYKGLTFDTWNRLSPKDRAGKLPAAGAAWLFAINENHYMTRAEIYAVYDLPDPTPNQPDRAKNCIVLFGAVGMGKTGLMAACANEIMARGGSVLYCRVVDVIEAYQSRYGHEDYPTATDVLNDFKTAPLLFLDEFEVINDKPDRLEKIETIIDARRANYLPTFITTNLDQERFRLAWGDRTADRVINMAHWISVEGVKLRQTESPLKAM